MIRQSFLHSDIWQAPKHKTITVRGICLQILNKALKSDFMEKLHDLESRLITANGDISVVSAHYTKMYRH